VRENPISCIALFVVQSAAAGPYTYSAVKELVNYEASPLANSELPSAKKLQQKHLRTRLQRLFTVPQSRIIFGVILNPLQSQMNLGVITAD